MKPLVCVLCKGGLVHLSKVVTSAIHLLEVGFRWALLAGFLWACGVGIFLGMKAPGGLMVVVCPLFFVGLAGSWFVVGRPP